MLDIEIITPSTKTALDVVSVDELASHLRLSPRLRSNTQWVANMTAAIREAVSDLDGFSGKLNRMVLPCTLKRYLTSFPDSGRPILLPFPQTISVDAITIEDGSSTVLDPATYIKTGSLVAEVHCLTAWPSVPPAPRAVSITYKAGYETFPDQLKRLVKILAAHFLENPEATINEPRQMAINRRVDFGVDSLLAQLRIPVACDDWV